MKSELVELHLPGDLSASAIPSNALDALEARAYSFITAGGAVR